MALNKILKLAAAVGVVGVASVGSAAIGFVGGGYFAYSRVEELTKRVTEENSKRGRSGPYRSTKKNRITEMSGVSGHVRWYGRTPNEQQIDAVETSSELVIRHLGLVDENDKTTEHTKFGLVSYNTTTYGWSVVLERIYDSPVSFAGPRYRITHHHNDDYMTLTEVAKNGDGLSTQYPMVKTELGSDVTSTRVRELLVQLSSYEGFEEICDINDISQVDALVNKLTPIILDNRENKQRTERIARALAKHEARLSDPTTLTYEERQTRLRDSYDALTQKLNEKKGPRSEEMLRMATAGCSVADIAEHYEMPMAKTAVVLKNLISNAATDLTVARASREEIAKLVELSARVMDETRDGLQDKLQQENDKLVTFRDFMKESADVFMTQDGCTLNQAWSMYYNYCMNNEARFTMAMHQFRDGLSGYFETFADKAVVDGQPMRSYFSGYIAEDAESEDSDARVDLARRYLDNMINEGNSPDDPNYAPLEFHGFSTLPGDNWSVLFGVNEGVWRVKYDSKTDELSAVDEGH